MPKCSGLMTHVLELVYPNKKLFVTTITMKQQSSSNMRKNEFPPPYASQPKQTRKMRYSLVVTTPFIVTRGGLLDFMVAAGDSPSSNFCRVAGSVVLRRVMLWGVGTASGSSTVTLEWLGPNLPATEITDTGNPMRPAHISAAPPKNSFAELWSCTGYNETDPLFTVTGSQGDVMDLLIEYVPADGVTPQIATAGPHLPVVYYTSLLNPGNITPVSLAYAGV